MRRQAGFALWAIVAALPFAVAQSSASSDGAVQAGGSSIPFSSYASPEAKQSFVEKLNAIAQAKAAAQTAPPQDQRLDAFILEQRAKADAERKKIAEHMATVFPVELTTQRIGGVLTDVVTPKGGVSVENKHRVLINLHGGGMIFGARYEGQVLSIPIASIGRIKVISVDYRMAPEARFRAASEDVAAVYAGLLKEYSPQNVGIYGCSSGGDLTFQALAWFQGHHLPRPGAVGVLCAGGQPFPSGDSYYVAPILSGGVAPAQSAALDDRLFARALNLYTSAADPHDPLLDPMSDVEVYAKFPPVLFVNATRDGSMSAAIHSHLQLVKAGVDAELYLWDGLEHAFMYNLSLPESREAYDVIVKFFERRLAR